MEKTLRKGANHEKIAFIGFIELVSFWMWIAKGSHLEELGPYEIQLVGIQKPDVRNG